VILIEKFLKKTGTLKWESDLKVNLNKLTRGNA
jgi:hypothetical protein